MNTQMASHNYLSYATAERVAYIRDMLVCNTRICFKWLRYVLCMIRVPSNTISQRTLKTQTNFPHHKHVSGTNNKLKLGFIATLTCHFVYQIYVGNTTKGIKLWYFILV